LWVAPLDAVVLPPALAAPLVLPPALAARAAVLAFGDEVLDLQLPDRNDLWLSPGGRDLAAAYLLPRAEAALRQELLQSRCSGWPTPPSERAKARAVLERPARALTPVSLLQAAHELWLLKSASRYLHVVAFQHGSSPNAAAAAAAAAARRSWAVPVAWAAPAGLPAVRAASRQVVGLRPLLSGRELAEGAAAAGTAPQLKQGLVSGRSSACRRTAGGAQAAELRGGLGAGARDGCGRAGPQGQRGGAAARRRRRRGAPALRVREGTAKGACCAQNNSADGSRKGVERTRGGSRRLREGTRCWLCATRSRSSRPAPRSWI
jgi:hypothetical protein